VEILKKKFSGSYCPKCKEPGSQFDIDPQLNILVKNTSNCYFHKGKLMLSYCSSHNMGYCEDCISHSICDGNNKDFKTFFKPDIIEEIIKQNDLNSFANLIIRNFEDNFKTKRIKMKEKIKTLRKWLDEFDKLYKEAEINLYNITEYIRTSKSESDFKVILAYSWAHELTNKFNMEFSDTEKRFNQDIKNLFYGIYGEEDIFNIVEKQFPSICVKDFTMPSYLNCEDVSEVTFTSEEAFTLESIYFGLPLVDGGSGILTKIEMFHYPNNNPAPIPIEDPNQKLEFSPSKKYSEVRINPAPKLISKMKYHLICHYSGKETFKAYSSNPPSLPGVKIELPDLNTIFKSRIFGLNLNKLK
jgi:hypothetical protein